MLDLIFKCLYFMLPAYFANMAPVLVKDLHIFDFLAKPIDFGKKLGGKPIVGSHKTFRGLIFGIIFAIIISYIQYKLSAYPFFSNLNLLDYSSWLMIGFLFGFGALFGDAVKSFFKRRLGIKPGNKFIPWDQLDYSIGALLLISFFYIPSLQMILTILILGFMLHITANHIGYYLKLREVKW